MPSSDSSQASQALLQVVCASEWLRATRATRPTRPTRPTRLSQALLHSHHWCIFENKTLTHADTLMQPHTNAHMWLFAHAPKR